MSYEPELIVLDPPDTLPAACERINRNLGTIAEALEDSGGLRNWAGEAAPTANDDSESGVRIGDVWTFDGDVWTCLDNFTGAAIWEKHLKIGTSSGTVCDGNDARLTASVAHVAAAAPHSGHEVTSAKGTANGYAGLDANSKVPIGQIPAVAITNTFVVASQNAMLALTCETGDVAVRSDQNKCYILVGSSPGTLGDWQELLTPTDNVLSVDGATGVVTLSATYQALSQKGAASGYAGLDAASKVDSYVSDAGASTKGKVQLAGQLGGTAESPTVVGLVESGASTSLSIGTIADGQYVKRSGTSLVGDARYEYITLTIDGGGIAITTGAKAWYQFNYSGTIKSWTLLADQSGSIVIDVWKDTYANYPPTVADTITASAKPTLSSAISGTSSTLTGWTTSVSAGDVFKFNVDSATTVTKVTLTLKVQI